MYKILMIIGVGFIILGFIGIMALIWAPFFSAIRAVFFRDRDDLIYQTEAGKSYLRKENIFLIKICVFLILIGCLLYGWCYFVMYGPKGNGSIFSADKEGVGKNDEATDTESASENIVLKDKFGGVSNNEIGPNQYYIAISGTEIEFDAQNFKDVQGFESYLINNYKRTAGKFVLVDDYAIKKTFDDVVNVVDINGYSYSIYDSE